MLRGEATNTNFKVFGLTPPSWYPANEANTRIWKLEIFPLMCAADKVWINELTLIHKNIRSVRNSHAQVYQSIWCKPHYDVIDKNNNVSSEDLDRHYHKYPSSAYRTCWDISDNVCLNLQNCCYSLCIFVTYMTYIIIISWFVVFSHRYRWQHLTLFKRLINIM